MNAKIADGKIQIDVSDLVDSMSAEDKRRIARSLCADDYLIKAVLEIVADTSPSGYGHFFEDDEDNGPWWFCSRTVLELREKLLPLMPTAARQAVLEALRQRDAAKADLKRHSDWAWRLYHAWPKDSHWRGMPQLPDWAPAQSVEGALEAEAEALLAARTQGDGE